MNMCDGGYTDQVQTRTFMGDMLLGGIGWSAKTTEVKLKMNPWLQVQFLNKVGLPSGQEGLAAIEADLKKNADIIKLDYKVKIQTTELMP